MAKSKAVLATVTASNFDTLRFAFQNTPVATGATAVLRFFPDREKPVLTFEDSNPRMVNMGMEPMSMSPAHFKAARSAIFPLTQRRSEKTTPEGKADKKAFILSTSKRLTDEESSVRDATALLNLKRAFNKLTLRFVEAGQSEASLAWTKWLAPQAQAIANHIQKSADDLVAQRKLSLFEQPEKCSTWLWNFFKNEEKLKKGSDLWSPPEKPEKNWAEWMFDSKKIHQFPFMTVKEILEGRNCPEHCVTFIKTCESLLAEAKEVWKSNLKIDFDTPDKNARVFLATKVFLPPNSEALYEDRDDKSISFLEWFGSKDLDKSVRSDPSNMDNLIVLFTIMCLRHGVIPRNHYRGDKSTQILRVLMGKEEHKKFLDSKDMIMSSAIPAKRKELEIPEALIALSENKDAKIVSVGRLLETGVGKLEGFIRSAGVSWHAAKIQTHFEKIEKLDVKATAAPPEPARADLGGFSLAPRSQADLDQIKTWYPKLFKLKTTKEKEELADAIPALGRNAAKVLASFGMTVPEMITVFQRAPMGMRKEVALENAAWAASHADGITRFSLEESKNDIDGFDFE
jgi:hypothetical protein